jgi:trimeric autotransporter adhesin
LGACSLRLNTTGQCNTASGANALLNNTTGASNVANGTRALFCNTTGTLNIALGEDALRENVEGDQSVAIGHNALRNQNPVGNADMNNVAVGYQAACATTTGINNTAVGACALRLNTTGNANVALGQSALGSNTTACSSVAVGVNALSANTTGCLNTALGRDALIANTTGSFNTAVGCGALCSNTTGLQNTAVGQNALNAVTTGIDNTSLGVSALFNATGSNNIGIGKNAGRTGGTPEGIVNITTESNRIVMGNDDHTCAQIKIAWTATSDCRDKTCFKPIAHGLDFVRALKPTEYQFKQGGRDSAETDGKRRYGFLAQDILPLEGDAPVIISADNPEKLQYTESHLIPILVKAIQELTARVEELENNA